MGIKEWWASLMEPIDDPEDDYDNDKKEQGSEIDFVTAEELEDFEGSYYGRLEIMLKELDVIKEALPTEGIALIKKIQNLQDRLEDPSMDDYTVETELGSIEEEFSDLQRKVDGVYKINELKKQNNNMLKRFKEAHTQGELISSIKEFKDYIARIQETVSESDSSSNPIFSKVQREIFNKESLKAEYRLKMLILLSKVADSGYSLSEIKENPFADLPLAKQKIFSSYLLEDARTLGEDFDRLLRSKGLIGRYYYSTSMSTLDGYATELDKVVADAYVTGDFSPSLLFDSNQKDIDSFMFLKKVAFLRYHTNQITSKLSEFVEEDLRRREQEQKDAEEREQRKKEEAIKKEEQAKKAAEEAEAKRKKDEEEKNKYKVITNEEIEKEIARIAGDLASDGSRYVNVLDFQKMVAREKGLLTTEPQVQAKGLAYIPVNISTLFSMIKLANEEGVSYTVFPKASEFSNDLNYLFLVSESDKSKVTPPSTKPFRSYSYSSYGESEFGEYTLPVMWMIHKRLKEDLKDSSKRYKELLDEVQYESAGNDRYRLKYVYSYDDEGTSVADKKRTITQNAIKTVYSGLQTNSLDSEELLKDVKCYLRVPAQRNIMPILEELQRAGIEAFLEPVPTDKKSRNQKNRDFINIYFNRSDLGKYREAVEPKVSTKTSPIMLGGVDLNFAKTMLEECNFEKAGIGKKEK